MKKLKKLILSGVVLKLLGAILFVYIRLCYATSRWNISGKEILHSFKNSDKAAIICFWHGRLMLTFGMVPHVGKAGVISSRSSDGEVSATIMRLFGLSVVRGSSNRKGKDKGGTAALRETIRALRAGTTIALSPDGPRGPRMRVSGAIIDMALIAGVPIIPTAQSSKPSKIFNSWDRLMLILPFSKMEMKIGEPIYVDKKDDKEKKRVELENSMNKITKEIDNKLGQPEINPA